ncbi:MAG: ferrous iron transporter B [Limnochordia bacterium]
MRIALAGNPNCGKTTLYNALTGKTESAGNWSGVTVEKKAAKLKRKYGAFGTEIIIVDLPGAYSITPYTAEEAITRDFILEHRPDVIINIVDGANLERSLFMTTQLLELGIPVVIALNKSDIIQERNDRVDIKRLQSELGCPIISKVATEAQGLRELIAAAEKAAGKPQRRVTPVFGDEAVLERHKFVEQIAARAIVKGDNLRRVWLSDSIDRIIANQWIGLPVFFLVMWAVYAFSIEGLGGFLSDYFNETLFGEVIPSAADNLLSSLEIHPFLRDLILEGVIAGIGAVIGFLPLIMVLFFCLALLEDSGYMARVALVMDRHFKRIGLSGKSIIPMIVGSGCAIPGVMATRTIEDAGERRVTAILTPYVPCGAKLPIIALFATVFFPGASWVAPSMYILAICVIIVGGLLLKKLFLWENTSVFILELPEYKRPSLKYASSQMLRHSKAFIHKVATIILVMNTLVWLMQEYTWLLQPAADQSQSMLGTIGSVLELVLKPLGLRGWQPGAAAITGFVAKENVVSSLAILLSEGSEAVLSTPGGPLAGLFNPVTAYAFLIFNLFTPPCFAAIGAMRGELGAEWLWKGLLFQIGVGYTLAMLVSQIGSLVIYQAPAPGLPAAVGISAALGVFLFIKIKDTAAKRQALNLAAETRS